MRAWCSLLLQQVFSSSAPLVISCSLFPIIFLCLGGVLLPLKLSFCLKTYWLVYPFNLSYLLRLPIDLSILSIFLTFEVTYWLVYPSIFLTFEVYLLNYFTFYLLTMQRYDCLRTQQWRITSFFIFLHCFWCKSSVCVRTHLVDVHQKNVRNLQIYS